MKAATKISPVDLAEIDDFCDALWLDDGLAKTSLASYRSDLMRVAAWAAKHDAGPLIRIGEPALVRFIAEVSSSLKASSQARYVSTLRRFYRYLLTRNRITSDPTLKVALPAKPTRLPKIVSEKQV